MRVWKNEVDLTKIGDDGVDHNKLRFYRTLKGSFTIEPYIQLVTNRNQRVRLTRLRTSAHSLRVEQGRYTVPITPLRDRVCVYCRDDITGQQYLDDEQHLLSSCTTFLLKRNCLFGKIASIDKSFLLLNAQQKMAKMLCPKNVKIAKLVNKFISIIIKARNRIDRGEEIDQGLFTDCNLNDSAISEINGEVREGGNLFPGTHFN